VCFHLELGDLDSGFTGLESFLDVAPGCSGEGFLLRKRCGDFGERFFGLVDLLAELPDLGVIIGAEVERAANWLFPQRVCRDGECGAVAAARSRARLDAALSATRPRSARSASYIFPARAGLAVV